MLSIIIVILNKSDLIQSVFYFHAKYFIEEK